MKEWNLNIGIAPYIDAFGDKRASYQAVIGGVAYATASFKNGKPESTLSVESRVCLGSFLSEAAAHFNSAVAIRFNGSGRISHV